MIAGVCAYCGSEALLTRDHIVPRSRGGAHDPSNITRACQPCNTYKGNWLLDELPADWPALARAGATRRSWKRRGQAERKVS